MTTLEDRLYEIQQELDLALSNPLIDALEGESWAYRTIQTLLDEFRLLRADHCKDDDYWKAEALAQRKLAGANLRLAAERATEIVELRKQIKELQDETQKAQASA